MRRSGSKLNLSFTLVEILLVVSLITMISLTLYNAFASGLRLWDRAQRFVIEEDIAIFLEKIEQELRNTYFFSQFSFKGRTHTIAFPSLVGILSKKEGQQGYVFQPGVVEYFFDPLKDNFYKRQADYAKSLNGSFSESRLILSQIKSVEFHYFLRGSQGKLLPAQITDELPRGVRVDVNFWDEKGNEKKISKLIYIPLAQQM